MVGHARELSDRMVVYNLISVSLAGNGIGVHPSAAGLLRFTLAQTWKDL